MAQILEFSGFVAQLTEIVEAVDAGVVAITKIELKGISANGAPSANDHAWKGFLISPTILLSKEVTFSRVLGAR